MKKLRCHLIMTLLLTGACSSNSQSPNQKVTLQNNQQLGFPKPTPPAEEADRSVTELIRQLPFLEQEKIASLLRTWKQKVPNHAAYRAVKPSDFRIPGWVEKEAYWSDVVHSTGWTSDYGEMNGAYGLIVFIVDTSIADVNRFSVVAFIERPANQYTVHWILRDKDLSRVNLRRHSGNVYLQEFRDDGTSRVCDVQWDRKQARWGCDLDAPAGQPFK